MATISDQLKLKIERLKALEDVSPIPLRGQITLAYRKEVLAAILQIIEKNGNDEEKLFADLKIFLAENWKKYSLSPVGYTALPDDPITEFLCDIATEIAQNLKNKNPAEGASIETSPSPIHILMPGVQTQVTVDSAVYPDLDSLPLQQVIKTHIINRNGKYLLPVKFLIQITPSGVETNICNHYYDGLSDDPTIRDDALAYLDAEEKQRLFQHSFETRSVIEAKRHFDALTNDSSNLLSHLNTLIIGLRFHSKQGLGSEGAASEGVYILILNFQQFYDKLTSEQKNTIPPLVRAEIDLLLNTTDKTKARYNQVVAEGDIAPQPTVTTCIDTRQKVLSDVMRTHEETLANITLSAESKIELIKDATQALAEAQKVLVEKTENLVSYKGADNLKIPNIEFLHDLGAKFSIAHIEDLTLLSVDDFNVLCLNETYRSEIVMSFNKDPINAYADLATFAFLSKPDMLGAVLSQFTEELFDTTMERKPEWIGMLLNLLNNERFEIACSAMSGYFKEIFYNASPYEANKPKIFFSALMGALSADKQHFLTTQIIDMSRLVSVSQFIFLINGLNLAQKTIIIETHLKDLSRKLHNIDELKAILHVMPKELHAVFFNESISHGFFPLIKFADLKFLKEYMPADLFLRFMTTLMEHQPAFLDSWADLIAFQKWMPEELFIPFIVAQLKHLDNNHLHILLTGLSRGVDDQWGDSFKDGFVRYMDVFLACKEEDRKIFVRGTQECLMKLLPYRHRFELELILKALCGKIHLESLLSDLISPETVYLIPIALYFLDENERYKKEAIINDGFKKIINYGTYFSRKNKESITYGLYAISSVLPEIIECPNVFAEWMDARERQHPYLAVFNPEQRSIIFNAMKPVLVNMINRERSDERTFKFIMEHLTIEQRTEIFEAIKFSILQYPCCEEVVGIAKWISPVQQNELFSRLLNEANGNLKWIHDVDNFFKLAKILDKDVFATIAERMIKTGQLAKYLRFHTDIPELNSILTPEQMKEVKTQWMSDFLPSYNKRLSFFSSPFSAKWSESADVETVLRYANDNRTSRTAAVVFK